MPVGIVQVMNNTSQTLNYENLESGHLITVPAKTQQYENDEGWIPSSNFYDDGVPFYGSSHIRIWLGDQGADNSPKAQISDDNWKFHIIGPAPFTSEQFEGTYGSLSNGGQYIMRVDEQKDALSLNVALSFLKYEAQYKVTVGWAVLQTIQNAAPIVAVVLMALFL